MAKSHLDLIGSKGGTKAHNESALNPVAQSATLCKLSSKDKEIIDQANRLTAIDSVLPVTDKAVIELMFLNGLRISEVLNIKASDVMFNGLIKIKGLKGSENRLCVTNLYRDWWLKSVAKGNVITDYRSRYYYHRLFVEKGLYYRATKNCKRIVTHVFRHLYIRLAESNDLSLRDIQSMIGHKSINSTIYYHEQKEKRI